MPAYFLTFRTYGTWLHGDKRGSVDADNREFGAPVITRDDGLRNRRERAMKNSPFLLDSTAKREAVERAIRETCGLRGWSLLALNVRTNHVHVVVVADHHKEKVLADLKAWATRALRSSALASAHSDVWSHHGSTHVLGSEAALEAAIQYTVFEQGPDLL